MMIELETFLALTRYFSIIHHIPGRIRFRVDPSIREMTDKISAKEVEQWPEQIRGIREVKLNPLAGSVTVMYDPATLPNTFWPALLSQNPDSATVSLLQSILPPKESHAH